MAYDSLLIIVRRGVVVRVGPQDQEILNNMCLRQVLICGELSSLALTNEDGRVMGLEACDTFGFAGLANSIYGVTHTDLGLNWLQILVQSNQHTRVDRQGQVEQEVMELSGNEGLHVGGGEEHCEETGQGNVREKEFVRVEWVQSEEALAHVYEALSNSDNEKLIGCRWSSEIAC